MNTSRLGCLTPAGLIAAGLTVLIVVVITLLQGGVLFTPGDLNAQSGSPLRGYTSHAEFGRQCRLCHAPFWDTAGMAGRCLACHTDIALQMSDSETLHGAFAQTPDLTCRDCHPEHRGPNAPLTELTTAFFPHEKVGFSLAGHAVNQNGLPFACKDCHGEDITVFDQQTCQTCHRQINVMFMTEHLLSFGNNCLDCHDGIDTFGNDFDHNRFAFSLEGQHASVPCSSCHLNARTVADLRSAPVDCFSCHAQDDPHQGNFGTDCAACHTPNGWLPALFDHSLAAFKLEGKHATVKCESCHINQVFKGTPTDCFSCHAQDDPHQGNFGTDCAACHTPVGWELVTFDHNLTNFPLTGAHVGLACTRCHVNNIFQELSTACVSCHAEPAYHAGLFIGIQCDNCHNTSAWRPATFLGPHTFPLNHGGSASCVTCHPNALTAYTCYGCHEHDPQKIRAKHLEEGISDFANCIACHPTGQEHEGGGDDD